MIEGPTQWRNRNLEQSAFARRRAANSTISTRTRSSRPIRASPSRARCSSRRRRPAAKPADDEEEAEVAEGAVEVVSLDEADAEASEKDAVVTSEDDIEVEDDIAPEDDTFLEEDEEGDDDVADLIDGDIEGDEDV